MSRTYIIPANKREIIIARLNKLINKANKLNFENFSYTVSEPKICDVPVHFGDKIVMEKHPAIEVTIEGETELQYDGWEFVASITHMDEGNVVHSIGQYNIPDSYWHTKSICQHCNINRTRNKTFLLKKEDEFIQVGSSCIKDFLGGNCPDNILAKAEYLTNLIGYLKGFGFGQVQHEFFELNNFLAACNLTIRSFGYISKTKAQEENLIPTCRAAENFLYTDDIKQIDKDKANSVIEWAENLSEDKINQSDYLKNIHMIAKSGLVYHRTSGYAASMISAYEREQPKKEIISEFVGTIGKRESFIVKHVKSVSFESAYGYGWVHLFDDVSGNRLTWKTTSNIEIESNTFVTIIGTVKDHLTFKNQKQTVLNRCKIK